MNSKAEILKEILEKKDVLFGAFSDRLTKEMKNKEWMNIHLKAQSLGIVPLNKDMSYTRYTFWQNIRKNTMVSVKY